MSIESSPLVRAKRPLENPQNAVRETTTLDASSNEEAGHSSTSGCTATEGTDSSIKEQVTGLQPWQRPPFEKGHELSLKYGHYSERKIGERATIVQQEMAAKYPHVANDPDCAGPFALYCRSVAREELGHEALEQGKFNARLLESVTAAARAARELGDALGIGPRAAAELRQIRAETALSVATLVREAPAVLEAVTNALAAIGLAERTEDFRVALAAELALVAGDD